MKERYNIKRNDLCPCESGKKYKYCCEGKVDWNQIIKEGKDRTPYFSIRGRNLLFINKIAEALQLDSVIPSSLQELRAAFTPEAVKKIHEALIDIWPPNTDIHSVLQGARSDVSGLYVGDYRREYIFKGLIRHSIYANKIIVVDPFVYPYSVREKYNPILAPEQYRKETLKNVNFWFLLAPWIDAGIVEIIRTPNDFDRRLNWNSLKKQYKKFEENEELRKILEKSVSELSTRQREKEIFKQLILPAPNEYLKKVFKDADLGKHGLTLEEFIAFIEEERGKDPDFLETFKPGKNTRQLISFSSGASYDIAKLTANLTGSYLVTDIYSRWKEIEIDRESQNIESREWSPLAKAFQNLEFKYLNNLNLEHALILRKEKRLEHLRVFLRKVWKSACTAESFSEINAKNLADELVSEIRRAEVEWKQIDLDLLKWLGAELLAVGEQIVSGSGYFFPAAFAIAGAIEIGVTQLKRKSFQDKFPAAFFMKLK
ncbi:SEC-C domain-containing protein [bacterium]|nr:SEC-C domain-containing protein [bacterium]MBU4511155.1 SEC-C domain-containing protein [bacterium]